MAPAGSQRPYTGCPGYPHFPQSYPHIYTLYKSREILIQFVMVMKIKKVRYQGDTGTNFKG